MSPWNCRTNVSKASISPSANRRSRSMSFSTVYYGPGASGLQGFQSSRERGVRLRRVKSGLFGRKSAYLGESHVHSHGPHSETDDGQTGSRRRYHSQLEEVTS